MLTRRANVNLIYENVDISKAIEDDLESFTYTDNASGVADDISISLFNDSKKWLYSWAPKKGDSIKAIINTFNWRHDKDTQKLFCGKFMVDDIGYSGRPLVVNIGAISIPASSDFMKVKQNRTWENVSLKLILESIAKNHSIVLHYDTTFNPIIKFIEQSDKSDSAFIYELCSNKGLAVKVYDDRLVIFREQEYEAKASIISFRENDLIHWEAKNTWTDTGYSGCEVAYTDPLTGNTYSYTFYDKKIKTNKIYKVNKVVSSLAEAELLAKSTLRVLNKKEFTMTIDIMGNTDMVASSCIDIVDLGIFDGKYYIDKATHTLGGYSTSLELHRVLEGY